MCNEYEFIKMNLEILHFMRSGLMNFMQPNTGFRSEYVKNVTIYECILQKCHGVVLQVFVCRSQVDVVWKGYVAQIICSYHALETNGTIIQALQLSHYKHTFQQHLLRLGFVNGDSVVIEPFSFGM